MRSLLLRWIGPSLVAVVVVTLYVWFVAPVLTDWRDDWAFLHASREFAIRQQQAQQQRATEQKKP